MTDPAHVATLPYPHGLPRRIHIAGTQNHRRTSETIVRDIDGNTVAWIRVYDGDEDLVDFLINAYNERRAEFAQTGPEA